MGNGPLPEEICVLLNSPNGANVVLPYIVAQFDPEANA